MLLINVIGVLLIAAIAWWFWFYGKKPAAMALNNQITVIVENGVYTPSRIEASTGTPIVLRFLRKDQSPCASTVVFADFNISEELPLNEPKDVTITPSSPGEFRFTCPMQMYRGDLLVR